MICTDYLSTFRVSEFYIYKIILIYYCCAYLIRKKNLQIIFFYLTQIRYMNLCKQQNTTSVIILAQAL
jgi:hypothetical protein